MCVGDVQEEMGKEVLKAIKVGDIGEWDLSKWLSKSRRENGLRKVRSDEGLRLKLVTLTELEETWEEKTISRRD